MSEVNDALDRAYQERDIWKNEAGRLAQRIQELRARAKPSVVLQQNRLLGERVNAAEREVTRLRAALRDVADWAENNPEQEHAPLSDSGVLGYAEAVLEEREPS